eukprot:scaffold2870_cov59-Cyclotella_meneghiniana.AAC.1
MPKRCPNDATNDATNDANDAKTMPERCQNDAKKKWRVGSNFYVQKIPIQKNLKIARALAGAGRVTPPADFCKTASNAREVDFVTCQG